MSKKITKYLNNILHQAEPMLQRRDIENAKELIFHGEFGVALELICEQLQEYEVSPSLAFAEVVKMTGQEMGMSPSLWQWMEGKCSEPARAKKMEGFDLIAIRNYRERGMSLEEAIAEQKKMNARANQ